MSRSKKRGWGSHSALWIWSLTLGTSTLAYATEPAGPMLIGAASDEVTASAPAEAAPVLPAPARKAEDVREARRLLLDLPGSDPLSAATSDLLLFGAGAIGGAGPDTEEDAQPALTEEETAELDFFGVPPIDETPAEPAQAVPGVEPAAPSAPAAPAPTKAAEQFSPEMLRLCDKLRTVLAKYYPRHQSARSNTPWEVMHAIIAYGVDTQIFREGPGSEKVNAIGYMSYNYPCHGQRMLYLNRGRIDASRGVGVQGHGGQFLAILAQSHVMHDYPMMVDGKQYTLSDLIDTEKATCVAGEELTFKLIALSHYLDSDATWKSDNGQQWSIQRLIKEELKQPIRGAACGGTHRLMGHSYSLYKRRQQNKPIDGEFARAQTFIRDYHRYTFSLQNPDGSFSTAWFERKGNEPSIDRKLKTTGHILEWISFSLSDEELRDPRMIKAVDFLATTLNNHDKHTWEIGPLGHGLHALLIYEDRVFKDVVPVKQSPLAKEHAEFPPLEARLRTDR